MVAILCIGARVEGFRKATFYVWTDYMTRKWAKVCIHYLQVFGVLKIVEVTSFEKIKTVKKWTGIKLNQIKSNEFLSSAT